jgi:hypothetical protein
LGAESLGLILHFRHQLYGIYALGESGKVFDYGVVVRSPPGC